MDASRFRRLAQHRHLWWPVLDEKPLSRSQALTIIDDALKQDDVPGETCEVDDLHALVASGKRFGTLYIDPPWKYNNQGTRAATGNHYKAGADNPKEGMTVEQIAGLPIGELAEQNSHLHLWTTNAFLFECPKLFEAWGFEFRSTFIWCKPQMGIGNYWRNSHEILLTAIRGDAKRFISKSLKSWIEHSRGKHSAKPEIVAEYIEKASPGPNRIELFARQQRPGWTVWGNEIQKTIFDLEFDQETGEVIP
jgi:N6-adenosine-specific RNA methylase IME4